MSEEIISQINLTIPSGMQAETKLIHIEQKPRYYRIGNGKRNSFMSTKPIPVDAIDEMTKMNAQEQWTLKLVKDNLILLEIRTPTGIAFKTSCRSIINSASLSGSEKQKLKAGYKKLNEKGLLRRIKRQHYMLNPNFLIPEFYDEEMKLFDSLE